MSESFELDTQISLIDQLNKALYQSALLILSKGQDITEVATGPYARTLQNAIATRTITVEFRQRDDSSWYLELGRVVNGQYEAVTDVSQLRTKKYFPKNETNAFQQSGVDMDTVSMKE